MITASSLGFRAAALIFLNRPAVVAIIFRLDANVGIGARKRKRPASQFCERWRGLRESPKKPDAPVPVRPDRRHLPLSRQRPDPGAARPRRAEPGPDAPRRSPLRHRKRPLRLRSGRAEMAAKAAFPDAAAGRMAGAAAYPFRRCETRPDHPPERRGRGPGRPRNRRGPGCHRAVLRQPICRRDQGTAKNPDQPRPQLFGCRPQGGLDHQSGQRPRHREHGRPSRPPAALPRQPLCRGLAGLARVRAARPHARHRRDAG